MPVNAPGGSPINAFIGNAEPQHAQAVRMLVPEAVHAADAFVACDDSGRVVGAGVILGRFREKPLRGPGIGLHVIPTHRRQGTGTRLMESLLDAARKQGAEAVYAMRRVEEGSDEHRMWQHLGFTPAEKVLRHAIQSESIVSRLDPLLRQMLEKNWVPPGARVLRLCDADFEEVARLHTEMLGGDRQNLLARIRCEAPNGFHPEYSRVLLLDGEVVGAILAHRESEDTAVVDANFVRADLRNGWANILVKLEATQRARELGIQRLIYETFDHYDDTRKFSEMLGGAVVSTKLLMHRPV